MHSTQHIVFHGLHQTVPAVTGSATVVAESPQPTVRAPAVLTSAADLDALAFAREALALAGLNPMAYRPGPLMRRMSACLRAANCRTLAQAREAIRHDHHCLQAVLDSLLIGVTWFYRDSSAAKTLRDHLRNPSRRWRVWSAGCSDGAELYTVAMMLDEVQQLEGCEFLGTDYRATAIERAREGRYQPERLEHLPANWREQHLSRRGGQWIVSDRLRQLMRWRTQDLLKANDDETQTFDLVLCRNVAIYLEQDAGQQLWRSLVQRLAPGGLLVVGKAERPERNIPLTRVGPCLYQVRNQVRNMDGEADAESSS